jgi:DNA repair protein RecN (Recombination protein N)
LAQADRVSVLVFDEIDANVGGRMGTVIGEKLRALASVHQVLCITHLPQIASFADRHLTIRKAMTGKETVTTVAVMEGESRVQELAEMTSGKEITATALAQARELLETAGRGAAGGNASVAKKERAGRKR